MTWYLVQSFISISFAFLVVYLSGRKYRSGKCISKAKFALIYIISVVSGMAIGIVFKYFFG